MIDKGTAALIISALTAFYSIYKSREERHRWRTINLARFTVQPKLMVWRVVTLAEFRSLNWGYDDHFATPAASDDAVLDVDKLGVPTAIVAVTPDMQIVETPPALTRDELIAELRRRQMKAENYLIMKRHRVVFAVTNVGVTAARDVHVSAQMSIDGAVFANLPKRLYVGGVAAARAFVVLHRVAHAVKRRFPADV